MGSRNPTDLRGTAVLTGSRRAVANVVDCSAGGPTARALAPYRGARVRLFLRDAVVSGRLLSWTSCGRRSLHLVADDGTDTFVPRDAVLAIEAF